MSVAARLFWFSVNLVFFVYFLSVGNPMYFLSAVGVMTGYHNLVYNEH